MIEIKGLCKSFGDKQLFKNYDLTINDGEFVVLSGDSGAGKTTLLNMIGGLEPIDSGTICIDGINILKKRNKLKYYKEIVSFLFQNFALVDKKTVRQNLRLVKKGIQSELTIEEALEKVDLLDKIDTKVFKLSGGEQQRVALARIMIKKSSIILADEPTGSLDSKNSKKVIEILKEINKQGKTVVLVTHVEEYKCIGNKQININ